MGFFRELATPLVIAATALAQTIPPPGQPLQKGSVGEFELVGDSVVSAQQVRISITFPRNLQTQALRKALPGYRRQSLHCR